MNIFFGLLVSSLMIAAAPLLAMEHKEETGELESSRISSLAPGMDPISAFKQGSLIAFVEKINEQLKNAKSAETRDSSLFHLAMARKTTNELYALIIRTSLELKKV